MNLSEFNIINEAFFAERISPIQLDYLLAEGWRHFGTYFFRYNVGYYEYERRMVLPLRIRLAEFELSKSQKRVMNRNRDFETVVRPAVLDQTKHKLFERHAVRFAQHRPDSLMTFLDAHPSHTPVETLEFCVYDDAKLVAVSFLDLGSDTTSSVYAMFDPEYAKYSLGIYTLLLEIDYSRETDRKYLYQGYAYEGESFYDYKKRLAGSEVFDWDRNWNPL